MAKTKITEYDATASNNTDIDSINIAEGMAPSNVNNAMREMMAHLKDYVSGTGSQGLTLGGNLAIPNAGNIGSAGDTDAIAIASGGDVTLTQNLIIDKDSGIVKFGDDQEITLTHDHNLGLVLKNTLTTDSTPATLTLSTGEESVETDDLIGKISFIAPNETSGTDSILKNAEIRVTAEADFASDANAVRMEFYTGNSEEAGSTSTDSALAIDRYGSVYCGKGVKSNINGASTDIAEGRLNTTCDGRFGHGLVVKSVNSVTDTTFFPIAFFKNDGTGGCGINFNDTANTSAVVSVSDYRAKENVKDISNGIDTVKKLMPKQFTWKDDSSNKFYNGFLAHEVEDATPESHAVFGKKDLTENGVVKLQGMDASKLIPILTSAIKELIAKVEVLESK